MCDRSHRPTPVASRYGSRLEHGSAHAVDHARWSRRDFLSGLGLAAAGSAMVLGGTPIRAFGRTSLLAHLRGLETDRVLVLLQLGGGNDGLNTVIPKTNDLYYNARPIIGIPAGETIELTPDLGLHPSFSALTPVYGAGDMAVIQNVGYPDPDRSHFLSTDIWLSASDSDYILDTGWLGRTLDASYPDFEEAPTPYPLAVQMGGLSSMLFQGPVANMGMSLASPDLFERIASEGTLYDITNLPETTYGAEMAFVRSVANDSFTYAEAIRTAADAGENRVDYPPNNPLSANLEIVATLIKGRLGARIYHVSLNGFDLHANQGGAQGQHATLLRYLSDAVQAFLADLAADARDRDVLVMTFSEFGRRVNQNGSGGTDHGTAAPLFLFGGGIEGGVYGHPPDLEDLDEIGDLKFEFDFRSIYATILRDWFGLEEATVQSVLGDTFETLAFVSEPTATASEPAPVPQAFTLHANYPNPFNPATTIAYTLARTERVTLRVFDAQGRLVQTLVDGVQPSGYHALGFDGGHLASGAYFYRLQTADGAQTRQMTLVR